MPTLAVSPFRLYIDKYPMAFGLTAFFLSLVVLYILQRILFRPLMKKPPDLQTARIATPAEIDDLEQSIGGALPTPMREAYLDGRITRLPLPAKFNSRYGEEVISEFFAIDAQTNHQFVKSWRGIPNDAFVFACDDFDNYYFIRAGTNSVYYWDHDGGDVAKIFDSFEDFSNLLGLKPSN